jgi:hypothetical protein
VATVGEAVTVAPDVALSPVDGAQLYVVAPEAVIFVFDPLHIVAETGVADTVGMPLTVIVWVLVAEQPPALTPVMV